MKQFFLTLFTFFALFLTISQKMAAQSLPKREEENIIILLKTQESAWNQGDLSGFMKGYWESDSLVFIGKSGVTHGWANTLANYKRSYPDQATMGKLTFGILKIESFGKNSAFVIGSWRLDREKDVLQGYFSLLFRKNKKEWKIIADHSS